MDKNILIGLGGIASVGLIAGGIYLADNDFDFLKKSNDQIEKENQETAQKIEQLQFDELKDKERYSFCIGKEKITGTYTNTIMSNEEGQVNYSSEDISVLDKENNKIYILGRVIDYNYNGEGEYIIADGSGFVKTQENGRTTEYYKKNQAPVRADYNSKTLFPAPDRKEKNWVVVNIKMTGTMMGFTDTKTEQSQEDAKTFCMPINLGLVKGMDYVTTPNSIVYNGNCESSEVSPGVNFSGDYSYSCDFVDYDQAIDLIKNYQSKEEAQKAMNEAIQGEQQTNLGIEPSGEGEGGLGGLDERPSSEEMRKQLDELKDEMRGDVKAQ